MKEIIKEFFRKIATVEIVHIGWHYWNGLQITAISIDYDGRSSTFIGLEIRDKKLFLHILFFAITVELPFQ